MNTETASRPRNRTTARHTPRQEFATEADTLKILAVVDGSHASSAVLRQVHELNRRGKVDVLLLNVQPMPQDWRLRGYETFKRDEVEDRLISDLGGKVIESVGRQLDAAGIPHRHRIELGDSAETVLRCAREENCDVIVMAEAPPRSLRRWLMRTYSTVIGSAASVVAQLSPIPVVVAK